MLPVSFSARADTAGASLVVGVWQGGNPGAGARAADGAGAVARALAASPRFTGAEGQSVTVEAPAGVEAARLLILGLGPFGGLDAHGARRLGAVAAAALLATESPAVADLDLEPALAVAFAQGAALRAHRRLSWRSPAAEDTDRPRLSGLTVRLSASRAAEDLWQAAAAEAEGVLLARDLVDAPANVLTPSAFVDEARRLESLGVVVDVLRGTDELRAAGFGLLAAVGQGAAEPPALVTLRWPGRPGAGAGADAAADAAPLALVGKGITFDTGGLCLKGAAGMEAMKADMAGAAAVLGTIRALAAMGHPAPVTGVLAVAENAVGASAFRPGDVLTARSGLTVEIIDTDAEGRLVLADALASLDGHSPRPGRVVDVATLTGSIVTTLGRHHAGLFASDDALADALEAAGAVTGETLWRLPVSEALAADLDSPVADLRQCAPAGRFLPDALHAALFLRRFVPAGMAWAHLDMAGVGHTDEDRPLSPKGATGWGVRLLTALARA